MGKQLKKDGRVKDGLAYLSVIDVNRYQELSRPHELVRDPFRGPKRLVDITKYISHIIASICPWSHG